MAIQILFAILSPSDTELTTWETYNYIIYGLVDELTRLGCKDELALATLQLWTAYLRKNEIAFFGKKETHVPKFPFKYRQRYCSILQKFNKKLFFFFFKTMMFCFSEM